MSNLVMNVLRINSNEENIKKVTDFLYGGKKGDDELLFDFNKVIPMPATLNIEDGFALSSGLKYYELIRNNVPKDIAEKEVFANDKGCNVTRCLRLAKIAEYNMQKYNAHTWYNWCIDNWGTKWNAFDCSWGSEDHSIIKFMTAWNAPFRVILALSKLFKDISFDFKEAEEIGTCDGQNCNSISIKNGEGYIDTPSDWEARLEFSCELWNDNVESFKERLNEE